MARGGQGALGKRVSATGSQTDAYDEKNVAFPR